MVNQPMESADTVAIATRSELGGRGRGGRGLTRSELGGSELTGRDWAGVS